MSKILVIDDDKSICRSLQLQLKQKEHTVQTAQTASAGSTLFDSTSPDLIFLDITLPDANGLDLLSEFQKKAPLIPVIMITGRQDTSLIIEAMQRNALDYIRKPLNMEDVFIAIKKAQLQVSKNAAVVADSPDYLTSPHSIVGASREILEVIKQVGRLSQNRFPVFIQGESGTGKELIARALHTAGTPTEPFVAVNCAAIVPTLLASELFGHEQGAFTGAKGRRIGKLEFAGDGTFFLDEIGEIPPDFQAQLLRVLQEKEFERVGGNQPVKLRARIVAASHRNLQDMVRKGTFRDDLFYRISVGEIVIPPLRARQDDIPVLAAHFLQKHALSTHKSVVGIEQKGLDALMEHSFPGNVRELENIIARALIASSTGILSGTDIRNAIRSNFNHDIPGQILPLFEVEKLHIEAALDFYKWNISLTARKLEISPTTLRKKILDYKIQKPQD
ncbi:MAG: sigma-54-dependent Fis family transcriptional regulator [Acidobacteria bacterium]|nr:sigma-54-dependent Fis family transcriptional regulator [Acidobacteriota bacterium]